MASPAQTRRELLEIEDVAGLSRPVTVVRFLTKHIHDIELIETLGGQLYSLVEEHGRTNLVLSFCNVQSIATYLLGKLIGLNKRINLAEGQLVLCHVSKEHNPVVDEAFRVCGLKPSFTFRANEPEAVQTLVQQ